MKNLNLFLLLALGSSFIATKANDEAQPEIDFRSILNILIDTNAQHAESWLNQIVNNVAPELDQDDLADLGCLIMEARGGKISAERAAKYIEVINEALQKRFGLTIEEWKQEHGGMCRIG